MNQHIVVFLDFSTQHEGLKGYSIMSHQSFNHAVNNLNASPVRKFSGMLAASTHDKQAGFLIMCLQNTTMYSAYAPW